jgi:hypothetical protein
MNQACLALGREETCRFQWSPEYLPSPHGKKLGRGGQNRQPLSSVPHSIMEVTKNSQVQDYYIWPLASRLLWSICVKVGWGNIFYLRVCWLDFLLLNIETYGVLVSICILVLILQILGINLVFLNWWCYFMFFTVGFSFFFFFLSPFGFVFVE